MARKIGKLRKGGLPDRVQAAKMVLRDWNTGKVPFYTLPPEDVEGAGGGGIEGAKAAEAMFVEGFGREFDVEKEDAEVGTRVHRGGGRGWGVMKTHALVFRSLTTNPKDADAKLTVFSPARRHFTGVTRAVTNHPCLAMPTGFGHGVSVMRAWVSSRITKCFSFRRREYTISTARDFDRRVHVTLHTVNTSRRV